MMNARIYAIGDIHGEVTLLHALLTAISPQPEDILVFLGDYVDRGEDSVTTIDLLTELQEQVECVFLRGNHDQAWLEVATGYGYRRCPVIPGARAIWDAYHGLPPARLGRFMATTQLSYEDVYAYYSHAGARQGQPFSAAGPEAWVWGEPPFLQAPWTSSKPVVFGHYEVETPLVTRDKICLDTAGYRTGILTAMRMNDHTMFQTQRDSAAAAESGYTVRVATSK